MLNIDTQRHQSNLQLIANQELILKHQIRKIVDTPEPIMLKLKSIPSIFQAFIPFEYMRLTIPVDRNHDVTGYHFVRTGFDEYQIMNNKELLVTMGLSDDQKSNLSDEQWEKLLRKFYHLESKIVKGFDSPGKDPAEISIYSNEYDQYSEMHNQLLNKVAPELQELFRQLKSAESLNTFFPGADHAHKKEIVADRHRQIPEIIGNCPSFIRVLEQVSIVAPSDISVLVTGKSGTGKEKIARSLHEMSERRSKPMIIVNCGAMPVDLIESELFGHEKGSFTGATDKRIGKFEAAHGGTIFLDEVGELSQLAQVKLLRVLQEMEFERVGSCKSIKVDVRVISATNKNLEEEVAQGRFRLDLYYRLNIFQIDLPSLVERKADIPLLAKKFIERFATKHGKNVKALSSNALKTLRNYNWPGNIRELEHIIERTVLMAKGPTIHEVILPKEIWKPFLVDNGDDSSSPKTLKENEAEYIIKILKICGGKVAGPGGAAQVLDLPSTTLQSKLRKYGIRKDFAW